MTANKKIWIIALVILVAINVGSLSFLWLTRNPTTTNERPRRMRDAKTEQYISRRMGLSDDQRVQFREARKRHFQKLQPIQRELHKTRRKLYQMNNDEVPVEHINEDLAKIASLHKTIDSLTYIHFMELRSYCTAEQIDKFNAVIRDMQRNARGMRE